MKLTIENKKLLSELENIVLLDIKTTVPCRYLVYLTLKNITIDGITYISSNKSENGMPYAKNDLFYFGSVEIYLGTEEERDKIGINDYEFDKESNKYEVSFKNLEFLDKADKFFDDDSILIMQNDLCKIDLLLKRNRAEIVFNYELPKLVPLYKPELYRVLRKYDFNIKESGPGAKRNKI